jgi:hypothetical protein
MEVEEEAKQLISEASTRDSSDEDPFLAFKQPNTSYIEGLFFLSDSTILILLSNNEMRILDTQSFNPENYDAERIAE